MRTTHVTGGVDPEAVATRREFAAALTALREAAGLTVREVGRAAGISSSTVGGYFSGRHLPPLRPAGGLRAILLACGVTDPDELEAWQRALTRVRRGPGPRPTALPAPYRGLSVHGPDDAALFHGRDAEAALLLDRLTRRHPGADDLVVLLGRAGSGKTSLVGAAVRPALHGLGRPVVLLTPGTAPLADLAAGIARLVDGDPPAVHAALRDAPSAVREQLRGTAGPAPDRRPVIVVDQFESMIASGADAAAQTAFVRALAAAARPEPTSEPPATVLVVLRTEAVPHVACFPDLAAALRSTDDASPGRPRTVHLASMADDALRAAVLGPARRLGVDLDADLVDAVVADVAELERQGAAGLPRLSHALLATWRRDRRGRLTLAEYREAGGVLGSVDVAAEAVYRSLPEDARAALPSFLADYVAPEGLAGPAAAARDAFVTAGLLDRADADGLRRPPSAGLVQGWSRARGWRCGDPVEEPPAPAEEDRRPTNRGLPAAPPATGSPRVLGAGPSTRALDAATGTAAERGAWWRRWWRRDG